MYAYLTFAIERVDNHRAGWNVVRRARRVDAN